MKAEQGSIGRRGFLMGALELAALPSILAVGSGCSENYTGVAGELYPFKFSAEMKAAAGLALYNNEPELAMREVVTFLKEGVLDSHGLREAGKVFEIIHEKSGESPEWLVPSGTEVDLSQDQGAGSRFELFNVKRESYQGIKLEFTRLIESGRIAAAYNRMADVAKKDEVWLDDFAAPKGGLGLQCVALFVPYIVDEAKLDNVIATKTRTLKEEGTL